MKWMFPLLILLVLSCDKDDRMGSNPPQDNRMPAIVEILGFKVDNFGCKNMVASFNLSIDGDSTTVQKYGIEYENLNTNEEFNRVEEFQSSEYFVFLSGLELFSEYRIKPFVEILGERQYGDTVTLVFGENPANITSNKIFDFKDVDFGFSYLTESTGARIGDKAYFAGGGTSDPYNANTNTVTNAAWELDLSNGEIRELSSFPRKAMSMNSFVYNEEFYCGFGTNDVSVSSVFTDIYKYDIGQDSWTYVTDFPDQGGLAGGYAHVIGDKLYAGFGISGPDFMRSDEFYTYDFLNDEWTQLESSPIPLSTGPTFLIGEDIYIGDGVSRFMFRYSASTKTWTEVQSIVEIASDPVCFVRDGLAYVHSGGFASLEILQVYDPATDSWDRRCNDDLDSYTNEGVVFQNGNDIAVGLGSNSGIYSISF